MNSKQLAREWPFPRHRNFIKQLRIASSEWFAFKGFEVHPKMHYCLKSLDDWRNNIILGEVADYIERERKERTENFPLHKYTHHGLSSQAMVFNLIGPLIARNDFEPLVQLLKRKGVDISSGITSGQFEYEDRDVFNEDAGQPTSIDVVLKSDETPAVFIESKLVETEFGGCSVFQKGDCNGKSPIDDLKQCYLHFIGRKYWELLNEYGCTETLVNEKQCIFVAYYQFFREILFSLRMNGLFVLLSDARSPVFHCKIDGIDKGLMPFLMGFVPKKYKERVLSISIQELLEAIKHTKKHVDWTDEFEKKYGLA
jgi:hypothetical protein